jgi:uncharacterized membrane protein YoaK (UPF0700 family)
MNKFLNEVRQTLAPARNDKHGPLPPMLLGMTVVTGLVDAFSYLLLGHVFVANMTGNVVLLGFALVGAYGFSVQASVLAILSFALGALVGGRIGSWSGNRRDRLLGSATTIQVMLVSASIVLASLSGSPVSAAYRYSLITILALAMGVQNAAVRRLAVPDLTTTVLTLTITGIAADSAIAGGAGSKSGRRLLSAAAMLIGAVIGASLVVHSRIYLPLVIAFVVIALVSVASRTLAAPDAPWISAEL